MSRLEVGTALKPWGTSTVKGCGRVCAVPLLSLLFCCFRAYKQLPMWLIIASSKITLVNVCKIWEHWERMGRVGEKKKTDFNDLCLLPK